MRDACEDEAEREPVADLARAKILGRGEDEQDDANRQQQENGERMQHHADRRGEREHDVTQAREKLRGVLDFVPGQRICEPRHACNPRTLPL